MLGAREALAGLRRTFADGPSQTGRTRLRAIAGRLRAEAVGFAHGGGTEPLLRDIDFELPAGEVLGVVGLSGAGKSTLARLLIGVEQPSTGRVRLDGADLAQMDRCWLGPQLGYLPQQVELFAGTVAENIARMQAEPDSAAVIAAARAAGVHDMILQLPMGYDTEIGEGGCMLSGGQRQRLGLARALFGAPRLVELDEPNASLDQAGEAALLGAIAGLRQEGATVIVVTHRMSLLAAVDRVLVLEAGRISDHGPGREVMARIARPRAVARA